MTGPAIVNRGAVPELVRGDGTRIGFVNRKSEIFDVVPRISSGDRLVRRVLAFVIARPGSSGFAIGAALGPARERRKVYAAISRALDRGLLEVSDIGGGRLRYSAPPPSTPPVDPDMRLSVDFTRHEPPVEP